MPAPQLVRNASLPYLLRLPDTPGETHPVLCFLHGHAEGPPTTPAEGLTRHGPLRPRGAPDVVGQFIVVAPQLPARGDLWHLSAHQVHDIVLDVQSRHGGDPARTYLTGFSFGGNGVLDLALSQRGFWAALWAVDPTRVPDGDPGAPVWLSGGELARFRRAEFVERLALRENDPDGDRVFTDFGEDHVGSATTAYRDERIYRWLLARRLP